MICAGADIAKTDHVIGAVDETEAEVARPMGFRSTEAGFGRCVAWPESVAESEEDVFVDMEAGGHYWRARFAYLTAAGYRVCAANPMQVRAMRKGRASPAGRTTASTPGSSPRLCARATTTRRDWAPTRCRP